MYVENKGEVLIYENPQHQARVEVRLQDGTVWLTQKQIAQVFGTKIPAINKHIKNIIKNKELIPDLTISKMEIVQKEGGKLKSRTVEMYNLDMIISIGYRVNSQHATQFRIWATQHLNDHLVKGYTLNHERLRQLKDGFSQLEKTVKLIQQSGQTNSLKIDEAKGLLEIISNYTRSFILLNQFDSNRLETEELTENITYEIRYEEAVTAINELKRQLIAKKEASELFGNQKDDSFAGLLGNVVQSFGGQYVYATIEEQAAHLLYFVIKNHPFSDGNKRIGAFLFIWFLEKNHHRFKISGELKINDNGLTALALLVAQSNPNDKELMIKLIINLINF